jgi:serine/threonine-protein phosphatase 2A regulatory subunit A
LAEVANAEVVKDFIVPTCVRLAADPVPNIRFNVAKTFANVIPIVKKLEAKGINDLIKSTLVKLNEDADVDVRFYSKKSLSMM